MKHPFNGRDIKVSEYVAVRLYSTEDDQISRAQNGVDKITNVLGTLFQKLIDEELLSEKEVQDIVDKAGW